MTQSSARKYLMNDVRMLKDRLSKGVPHGEHWRLRGDCLKKMHRAKKRLDICTAPHSIHFYKTIAEEYAGIAAELEARMLIKATADRREARGG